MPTRPPHIPTHFERSALGRLLSREWDEVRNLQRAGTGIRMIERMIEKGWIEQLQDESALKVRITHAGREALKLKIPMQK
jgi:hypothetical protein